SAVLAIAIRRSNTKRVQHMPRHNEAKESGRDDCKDHERDDLLHNANPYRRMLILIAEKSATKAGQANPMHSVPVSLRLVARKPGYNNRKETRLLNSIDLVADVTARQNRFERPFLKNSPPPAHWLSLHFGLLFCLFRGRKCFRVRVTPKIA